MGLSRQERVTLVSLGLLAFAGLGVLAWQQRCRPFVIEREPMEAAAWDGALNQARRVDVNTASVAELERLPSIGPGLAQRIIAYRHAHGPFRRLEHLTGVKGIGEKTLHTLQAYVTVGNE